MSWNLKKFAPLFGLAVFASVLFVLSERLGDIEFSDIMQQIRSLPLPAVIGSMICCAAAYLLVGLYEGIALHRADDGG